MAKKLQKAQLGTIVKGVKTILKGDAAASKLFNGAKIVKKRRVPINKLGEQTSTIKKINPEAGKKMVVNMHHKRLQNKADKLDAKALKIATTVGVGLATVGGINAVLNKSKTKKNIKR